MPLRWYTARTQPRAEFTAAVQLEQDGFEIYVPKIQTINPQAKRSEVSLFPGYIFVRWDPDTNGWPLFRPIHRVTGWVNFGGDVPWLPEETVNALKDRSNSINLEGGLWHRYETGDRVQVISGNLEGIAEVLESAKSPDASVRVLLQFMGRTVRAQIPWKDLQPIQEQSQSPQTDYGLRPPRRTRGKGRWTHRHKDSSNETVGTV